LVYDTVRARLFEVPGLRPSVRPVARGVTASSATPSAAGVSRPHGHWIWTLRPLHALGLLFTRSCSHIIAQAASTQNWTRNSAFDQTSMENRALLSFIMAPCGAWEMGRNFRCD